MKKNKFSNAPSENSSPILSRRGGDLEGGEGHSESVMSSSGSSREGSAEKPQQQINSVDQNNYETIDRKTVTKRNRDPGYETIPGERCRRDLLDSLNATTALDSNKGNVRSAGTVGE